jgi:hypothetical protein
MKKLILTASLIVSVFTIATSQSTIDDQYSCVNQHYSNLTNCFQVNDVTGTYTGSGSILYFQPSAGIRFEQFNPCVDTYNKDRVSCPTSPLLVVGQSRKKKTIL